MGLISQHILRPMFITMEHYTKGEICHFDLYTRKKCNIIQKEKGNRKEEGAAAGQACSALRASPAEPTCPPTHARGPRSRASNTLPPARAQAADEPDPPVSRHALHAAASGQADRRAPSVSRPATASSSSPCSLHHVTESRPWSRREPRVTQIA